jgi:hypothetical protein
MADFIAVIRRAVDGLSENTPEMRAKVYERAKAAVVRQLENMKPRPPEAMFQRQIEKLDAAIREVEAEHATALPAEAPAAAIANEFASDAHAAAATVPAEMSAVDKSVAAAPVEEPIAAQPVDVPVAPARIEAPPVDAAVMAEPKPVAETAAVARRGPELDLVAPAPAVAPVPTPVAKAPEPLPEPTSAPAAAQKLEPILAAKQEFLPESAVPQVVHRELIPESALQTFGQIRRVEPAKSAVVIELPKKQVVEPAPEPIHVPAALTAVEPESDVPAYATSGAIAEEPVAHLQPEARPAQLDVSVAADTRTAEDHIAELLGGAKAFASPGATARQPFVPAAEPRMAPAVEARREPAAAPVARSVPAEKPAPVVLDDVRAKHTDDVKARVAPADEIPKPMPRVSYDETDVVEGFNDFLKQELNRQVVPPPPSKAKNKGDFSWDEPFDDLPDIPKPETFEKALEAKQQEIQAAPEKRKGKAQRAEPASARAELEDLLGLEPSQRKANAVNADAGMPPNFGRGVSRLEGKAFKTQARKKSKRRGRMLAIALGVAGVLVVAGGAYGVWLYRDKVESFVSGLMPQSKPVDTAKRDLSQDIKAANVNPAATTTDSKPAAKNTELASLNTDAGPQKFTERLMPDGTETKTDTAKVPVDQTLKEGKSVATQTAKEKEVAAATPTDTKTDTGNTTQPAQTDNQQQNDAQPLGATQKMFLYEERLGQTSPVAVPGTVVWHEKAETDDGKPDPAIEAQVDVPGRKISALITFKRNTDPSLPASHIIEIVFDLPKDFEEGNVDSIQRVAFKQTEQDRGNPLIAVPAKITDDFHMVALNDDADARKVNLELMKTRSWIDIPITYRNGRRALITLEKGATGTAVFDKVMGEWDALGSQTSTNQ